MSGGAQTDNWMEVLDGELKCTMDGELSDLGHDSEHRASVGLENVGIVQYSRSQLFSIVRHSEL